jgi:hypothetical protein
MTIEFHCPECNKRLRAPDEAAGKRAKCGGCGKVVSIPQAESPPDAGISPPDDWDPPARTAKESDYNPYATPQSGFDAPPQFEAPLGPLGSRRITANEVLEKTWSVYRANLWSTVVAFFVFGGVNALIGFAMGMFSAGLLSDLGDPLGPLLSMLTSMVLSMVINSFLTAGLAIFTLKGARDRRPIFTDLFAGGPYFTRMLLMTIVYWIPAIPFQIATIFLGASNGPVTLTASAIGLSLLGGLLSFVMYLVLAPLPYLIVDRDMPFVPALKLSEELTRGNRLNILAIVFVAGIYSMLGVALCVVGVLFTAPFAVFAPTVTYLCLTGQPVMREPSAT